MLEEKQTKKSALDEVLKDHISREIKWEATQKKVEEETCQFTKESLIGSDSGQEDSDMSWNVPGRAQIL